MAPRNNTRTRVALSGALLLIGALLTACATQPTSPRKPAADSAVSSSAGGKVIWQSGLQFVALRAQPAGVAANDQPHTVDAARLRSVLGSLQAKRGDKAGRAVFTSQALDKLCPALSRALSEARPHQDIAFAVVTRGPAPDTKMLLIHVQEALLTTGLVFYRNGQLNIIFGKMHTPFEVRYINTGKPPRLTPGSRNRRIQSGWRVTGDNDRVHPKAGRPDWVSITMSASVVPAASPSQQTSPKAGKPVHAATQGNTQYQSIARRLRILEKLHANGLITNKEYRQKREQILNNL